MVTAPPHTPFFLSLPYEHSINLQVGWNNTQCFIQSLFHYGHTAMAIQNSKVPFHGQCLPNIYFVQSLAATDRGKVTEPVKSFTGIEQKAKNQRGLPDTRSASSMKAIARNQFLHSLSVAYPLNNMKKKQQRDSYRTGESVYNYIPDKPSKFTPSTQEELLELADDFSSHSLKKWAIVTHTNGQQAPERPQWDTTSLRRQQILYREGIRYKDNITIVQPLWTTTWTFLKNKGNKNRMVIWSKSFYKTYVKRKCSGCQGDTRTPTTANYSQQTKK